MSEFKQIHMRCPDVVKCLKPISLKAGYGIHTHIEGQEEIWEDIISSAFNYRSHFHAYHEKVGGYKPEYILYVTKDGKEISTAMGTENPAFPGEGWFRMVASIPEARGTGAGKLVCMAVMHSLAARGYKSVVLSTDDDRLPAIGMYLSLGFEPVIFDDEHKERWEKIMKQLENR
jgi:ribosomal protein S18 acetylase RimI-like enzyme